MSVLARNMYREHYGDVDVNEILEQLDPYIIILARREMPWGSVVMERSDIEMEELAQNVRVKLWLNLRKDHIDNPRAYARRIAYTERIDMYRQQRHRALPLPVDEDGELQQGKVLNGEREWMRDPAEEVEREELLGDYITKVVAAVLMLPPQQKLAMICVMKELMDKPLALAEAFRKRGIDIAGVRWPEEKTAQLRLKASLVVARKKVRQMIEECVL